VTLGRRGHAFVGLLRAVRGLLLDTDELFGFFLLVVIGLELFASLKSHVVEGVIQGEIVLEVALIAIAQTLIILDTSRATAPSLIAQAGLVLALAAGFWLVRIARRDSPHPPAPSR
jgi:uncharacterized membrane protein (DUF373 family)